jgi:hypothetical protein
LLVYLILAFARQVFVMVGAVAQLGEHLLCKQGVSGSIPLSSTNSLWCRDERQNISFEENKSLHHFDEVLPVLQKS